MKIRGNISKSRTKYFCTYCMFFSEYFQTKKKLPHQKCQIISNCILNSFAIILVLCVKYVYGHDMHQAANGKLNRPAVIRVAQQEGPDR